MGFKDIFSQLLPFIGAAAGTMVAPGAGTSIGYSLGKAGSDALGSKKQGSPSLEMPSPTGDGNIDYLSDEELFSQNKANGVGGGIDINSIMSMFGKGGSGGSPLDMISSVAGGMQSKEPPKKDYFGGMSTPMVGNVNPFSAPQSILEKLKMQKMYR